MVSRYSYLCMGMFLLHACLFYAVPVTFLSPDQITTAPFSITSPGRYVLTDDVSFARAGGTAITINTSDVILDLNGKAIVNSGAGTENGISLASTFTNITIKNGTVRVFDGTGITVPAGSRDLTFDNITIIGVSNTVGTGFSFQGTAGSALRTSGIVMQNCQVSNCIRAIFAVATDAVAIYDSTFNYNGVEAVRAQDCKSWALDRCQAAFNAGIGCTIFDGAACWSIKNSDFSGNVSTSGAGRGITMQGSATRGGGGHIIENSTFCRNGSASATTYGLELLATHSSVIRNCFANGNYSQSNAAIGMEINGTAIVVTNCVANGNHSIASTIGYGLRINNSFGVRVLHSEFNNNASTGSGVGLLAQTSGTGRHFIYKCVANANASTAAGVGRGFQIDTGAAGCIIQNCIAAANTQRGFDNGSNTAGVNLFIGNSSFGHGTAGANNYVGSIPFLSVAATGPYPLAGSFDNRTLANLSFT